MDIIDIHNLNNRLESITLAPIIRIQMNQSLFADLDLVIRFVMIQ